MNFTFEVISGRDEYHQFDVPMFQSRKTFEFCTNLCEGVSRVMAEPADIVAGVVEVVGVATEGSVVAQILTVFLAVDGLPNGVDRLQNLSLNLKKSKIAISYKFQVTSNKILDHQKKLIFHL